MSLQTDFPTRLTTLCDGRPGLRGSIHIETHTPSAVDLSPSPRGEGRGEGELPSVSAPSIHQSTNPPIQFAAPPSPPHVEERAGERRYIQPAPLQSPLSHPMGEGQGVRASAAAEHPDATIQKPALAILDFISSDATLDRYSEIIQASGWRLENYQRNPVFQNSHQYGDIIHTLGRALTTELRQGRLFQRIQFATESNPIARIAHALYAGKFLNAVSVGFIPIRWENGDTSPRPSDGRGAGGEGFRRRYLEQELLEVSAVAIPANPNALALAYKSGAVAKSDITETAALLRQLTATETTNPILPINPIPAPMLALARELRDLFKHL